MSKNELQSSGERRRRVLRMARVELYNCTFLSYPARRCQLFLWNFPKRNGILNACFQSGAFLLQSYTEMIKVPVFLTGHGCVYENKKEN